VSKVVNLRTVRKQRARDTARRESASSAAVSGETRAEHDARRAEQDRRARHLDHHRRERDEPDD
jgi:Domain of unknown function (DUF4169)